MKKKKKVYIGKLIRHVSPMFMSLPADPMACNTNPSRYFFAPISQEVIIAHSLWNT